MKFRYATIGIFAMFVTFGFISGCSSGSTAIEPPTGPATTEIVTQAPEAPPAPPPKDKSRRPPP